MTGAVSNNATGNLLEGAQISVPALGLRTLSDNTGRYVLPALPAGTHEVVVTYVGLDPARTTVTVNDSASTTRNFDLTSVVYKLDAFKVTGEREGGAAAITAQRNAATKPLGPTVVERDPATRDFYNRTDEFTVTAERA